MKADSIKIKSACCILVMAMLLTGCMYPGEQHSSDQRTGFTYIPVVEAAVDLYQEKTGVLPIKNSDMSTPIYEKYIIDFNKLKQQNVLREIPPNAFEKGGVYYYVLINVDNDPTVKLMNIVLYQQVNDVQRIVNEYLYSHDNQLPIGEQIAPLWYEIDNKKLKSDSIEVHSLYSNQHNLLIVHETGEVAINYASDIMSTMQEQGVLETEIDESMDLREYLVKYHHFIPIKSFPYQWKNNEPAIMKVHRYQ